MAPWASRSVATVTSSIPLMFFTCSILLFGRITREKPSLFASWTLCCAMLTGKELYKLATKQPLNWKVINIQVEAKALALLGILLGTYFLSKWTGLFVVGAVFCCLGFLLYFRCRKKSYYSITRVIAVAIWAAFRFVLGVGF